MIAGERSCPGEYTRSPLSARETARYSLVETRDHDATESSRGGSHERAEKDNETTARPPPANSNDQLTNESLEAGRGRRQAQACARRSGSHALPEPPPTL